MTIGKAIQVSPYHGAWTVNISSGWSFEAYKETSRYSLWILRPGEPKELRQFEKLSNLLNSAKGGVEPSLAKTPLVSDRR